MQKLTSVGVVSLGKLMGMSALVLSMLVAFPYGLAITLFGFAKQPVLGFSFGLVAFLVPLTYGAVAFCFGCLYGLVVNLVLRLSGGLEVTIR